MTKHNYLHHYIFVLDTVVFRSSPVVVEFGAVRDLLTQVIFQTRPLHGPRGTAPPRHRGVSIY
eukprot:6186468-Pleurochrysis_carterae.AAC.1